MARPASRLSSRRGSVSAGDPWGQHADINLNPTRSSSSKLTIVRVPDSQLSPYTPTSPPISTISLQDPSLLSGLHHRRSSRRGGGPSSSASATNADGTPASRLSFAFSTFAPSVQNNTTPSLSPGSASSGNSSNARQSSPSSSPRMRPSSPSHLHRRVSSTSFSKPNYTPDQLVELARQSSNPKISVPSPLQSPLGSLSPSRSLGALSPGSAAAQASAASFSALPPDVYLPFIDRPAEVASLLSTPPTAKLFSLLAQTFPKADPAAPPYLPSSFNPVVTLSTPSPSITTLADLPSDSTTWDFPTLRRWLTTVDRTTAPDAEWVWRARRCVLAHSELIWERLKGALGVPPELEIYHPDEEWDDDEENAFLDSPVGGAEEFDNATTGPTSNSATPQAITPPSASTSQPVPGSLDCAQQGSSSSSSFDDEEDNENTHLSIEPIVASNQPTVPIPSNNNPPPLSLPASLSQSVSAQGESVGAAGLHDISEDQEEEEENVDHDADKSKAGEAEEQERQWQKELEPQVQGLRISTSPLPSSPMLPPTYPVRSPSISPPLTRKISRTSSHGSVSSLRLSSSFGNAYGIGIDGGSDADSEKGYDPVGERGPGNPLFPSNFARLAVGPTLLANNPSLRHPRPPPIPAYVNPRRFSASGRPTSWAEGWDPSKHEYAITVASESSVGVGGGE